MAVYNLLVFFSMRNRSLPDVLLLHSAGVHATQLAFSGVASYHFLSPGSTWKVVALHFLEMLTALTAITANEFHTALLIHTRDFFLGFRAWRTCFDAAAWRVSLLDPSSFSTEGYRAICKAGCFVLSLAGHRLLHLRARASGPPATFLRWRLPDRRDGVFVLKDLDVLPCQRDFTRYSPCRSGSAGGSGDALLPALPTRSTRLGKEKATLRRPRLSRHVAGERMHHSATRT